MDGVFINLTSDDVKINLDDNLYIIPSNVDLITPIRQIVKTDVIVSGIISSPLSEKEINFLQTSNWFNTEYNKIKRTEQNIKLTIPIVNSYVKYPFTKEQKDKIDSISNGRTRLFIITKDDAEYWSSGKFDCPFRNYRLFVNTLDGLNEYPIPKTYLDTFVNGVKNLIQ